MVQKYSLWSFPEAEAHCAYTFSQQNYWAMAADLLGAEGEVVQQLCEEN